MPHPPLLQQSPDPNLNNVTDTLNDTIPDDIATDNAMIQPTSALAIVPSPAPVVVQPPSPVVLMVHELALCPDDNEGVRRLPHPSETIKSNRYR